MKYHKSTLKMFKMSKLKPTKRMAFNFLRSYFDVLNKLEDDADKLNFLLSIINKQFLDQDPQHLNFLVELCYESQRHAIEKSVKGWKTANRTDLLGNPIPPKGSPLTPLKMSPLQEEQEKEQEKEEEKVEEENTLHNINVLKNHYLSKEQILKAVISNDKNNVKDLEDLKVKLDLFCDDLIEQGRLSESWKEFTSYFRNSLKIGKFNKKPSKPKNATEHKPKITF